MGSVGLARIAVAVGLVGGLASSGPSASAVGERPTFRIVLWADRDDDDADGVPDGEQSVLPPPTVVDFVPIDPRLAGARVEMRSGAEHARVVTAAGVPTPWGPSLPSTGWFEGLSPGTVELTATARGAIVQVILDVRGIEMRDGEGRRVDMARSHASLERDPPERLVSGSPEKYDDPDALRVVLELPDNGPWPNGDREIAVESVTSLGTRIDELPPLAVTPWPCPVASARVQCWASVPLRLVTDDVDRNHPLALGRSVEAQVGGAVVFRAGGRKAQMIRVLGPRGSPVGPIGRLRAVLRPFVVRISPGGAPAIGGTDAGAVQALRAEIAVASGVWGQCGLTLGDSRLLEVKIVDPPPSHLVAIGDDLGLPASGGEIRFRADGKSIAVRTLPSETPDAVASNLARTAERVGLSAEVSVNATVAPGIGPSVDVSLRRKDGVLVAADVAPGVPLSTDRTLTVRIGSVDLSDGLQHFTDMDAMAGTLEERTLLKALDDGDPSTIEVVVVPLFAGGGRIGESFIESDLSSIRNVVLLDRAGIRAAHSSLTLAHELGHVLMNLPGHPDDYGIDTPTLLMDSDAADSSPFGPRRIPLQQCARVVRQAGPRARSPLLTEWPIGPIPMAATRGSR